MPAYFNVDEEWWNSWNHDEFDGGAHSFKAEHQEKLCKIYKFFGISHPDELLWRRTVQLENSELLLLDKDNVTDKYRVRRMLELVQLPQSLGCQILCSSTSVASTRKKYCANCPVELKRRPSCKYRVQCAIRLKWVWSEYLGTNAIIICLNFYHQMCIFVFKLAPLLLIIIAKQLRIRPK